MCSTSRADPDRRPEAKASGRQASVSADNEVGRRPRGLTRDTRSPPVGCSMRRGGPCGVGCSPMPSCSSSGPAPCRRCVAAMTPRRPAGCPGQYLRLRGAVLRGSRADHPELHLQGLRRLSISDAGPGFRLPNVDPAGRVTFGDGPGACVVGRNWPADTGITSTHLEQWVWLRLAEKAAESARADALHQ